MAHLLSPTCVLARHVVGVICVQCGQKYHGVTSLTTIFQCDAGFGKQCAYLGERTNYRIEAFDADVKCHCASLEIYYCNHSERQTTEKNSRCTLLKSKLFGRTGHHVADCSSCELKELIGDEKK